MGVECVMDDDKIFFLLPCLGQMGKVCKLYNDERRFKICKNYKCRLLKEYISGELSYDSAIAVIRETLIRRQSVKEFSEMLRPDPNGREPSIFSFIRELNRSGKLEDPSFRRAYSKQILDCIIFQELLKKNFYPKKSKESQPDLR
jgi:hypothetical protein